MAKQATSRTKKETAVEVPVSRRGEDRRKGTEPVAVERRKVQRRRQIDPTTCERDYSDDEIEFMHALDAYKRRAGRMFPTCSEILEVLRDLHYLRVTPAQKAWLDRFPGEEPSTCGEDVCSEEASEELVAG